MANLRDIAQKMGISVSTVSRALNGNSGVGPQLQEKIRQVADEMGYSLQGRGGRATPDWNCAGIIVPEVKSEYYARILHTAIDLFEEKGYSSIFKLTDFRYERMIEAINSMSRVRVKCILMVMDEENFTQEVVSVLERTNLPIMLVTAKHYPLLDFDCIYFDEYSGIVRGLQHLAQRGYKRIACLSDKICATRIQAYKDALKLLEIPFDPQLLCIGNERGELGGYLCMKELLAQQNRPDAVFCAYDQMAIGAINAARKQGLSVPKDIAVLGFDNLTVSQFIEGGLTTIANPYKEMLSIALNVLLKRVKNPNATRQQIALSPDLVIRATT